MHNERIHQLDSFMYSVIVRNNEIIHKNGTQRSLWNFFDLIFNQEGKDLFWRGSPPLDQSYFYHSDLILICAHSDISHIHFLLNLFCKKMV